MSAGALVKQCELHQGTESSLLVCDNTITWRLGQRVHRKFELPSKADFVVSTVFKGVRSVAIVHGDFVQVYGEAGSYEVFGLPFKPVAVLPCQQGLVLTFSDKLFLARSAQLLVNLISPASNTKWLPEERLQHFGSKSTSIAVSTSIRETGEFNFRLYRIRFLEPNRSRIPNHSFNRRPIKRHSIAGNSGRRKVSSLRHHDFIKGTPGDSLEHQDTIPGHLVKDATISFIGSFFWPSQSSMRVISQRSGSIQAVCVISSVNALLKILVYDEFDSLLSETEMAAKAVVCLRGLELQDRGYPLLAIQKPTGLVELISAFTAANPPTSNVVLLEKADGELLEGDQNTFLIQARDGSIQRYQVQIDADSAMVKKCFAIAGRLLDTAQFYALIFTILALQYERPSLSAWQKFCLVVTAHFYKLKALTLSGTQPAGEFAYLDISNLELVSDTQVFPDISRLMVGLHLWHEEATLTRDSESEQCQLGKFLSWICFSLRWANWLKYYRLVEAPINSEIQAEILRSTDRAPPSILQHMRHVLEGARSDYPADAVTSGLYPISAMCLQLFEQLRDPYKSQRISLHFLADKKDGGLRLDNLVDSVGIPLTVVLASLRERPFALTPTSEQDLRIIGRTDLLRFVSPNPMRFTIDNAKTFFVDNLKSLLRANTLLAAKGDNASYQGASCLVFNKDRRYNEAVKMLQTSKPQTITLTKGNSLEYMGETEWFEVKNEIWQILSLRSLASSFGNAALLVSSLEPTATEKVETVPVQLDVRVVNDQSTVALSLDTEQHSIKSCGEFFLGVMAGLQVSAKANNLSGRWILNHRPRNISSKDHHAGFLLGLGFHGHLKHLEEWQIYGYLGEKNSLTAIGALLGLCISNRGSSDFKLTKVLSLHVRPLLPANSNDLKVSPEIEAAAILGTGILHESSKNRHISEVLALELLEGDSTRLGSYYLACGISLGLINTGAEKCLSGDDPLVTKLLRPISRFEDKPTSAVLLKSTDATVIGIMLMFLGSNSSTVATNVLPSLPLVMTQYFKPLQLYLRVLAFHMTLWDSIQGTRTWVESAISRIFPNRRKLVERDLNSDILPEICVEAAVCVAVCIKFAGTGDQNVVDAVCAHLDDVWQRLLRWPHDLFTDDERLTWINASQVYGSVLLALSYVVAGCGNLTVMKRARKLFQHVEGRLHCSDEYAIFSDFVNSSLALGILFMGEGRYTLKPSKQSAVYLLLSVLPGMNTRDENFVWTFLRFFWSVADRNERLVVKDTVTGAVVPAQLAFLMRDDRMLTLDAPAVVPDLDQVVQLTAVAEGYMPVSLNVAESKFTREKIYETSVLFVQKEKTDGTEVSSRVARTVSCLKSLSTNQSRNNESTNLQRMASCDPTAIHIRGCRLILSFYKFWLCEFGGDVLRPYDSEDLELALWQFNRSLELQTP